MTADITRYLALITSRHVDKPKFVSAVSASIQGLADAQDLVLEMPLDFDIDNAIGAQLDVVGLWVGRSRVLTVPIEGVYFSWGTQGVGWGEGIWKRKSDPLTGLTALPDDGYRTLLRAKIAANHWDGTIPGAYGVWDVIFVPRGINLLIQDQRGMKMIMALWADGQITVDAVTKALFGEGLLSLKPAGVQITRHVTNSVPGTPFFGWGVGPAPANRQFAWGDARSGWNKGVWDKPVLTPPEILSARVSGWGIGSWPVDATLARLEGG